MKSQWNCMYCTYFSGRKWNLDRHLEKMHGQKVNVPENHKDKKYFGAPRETTSQTRPNDAPLSMLEPWWQRIDEISKIQNRIANSSQTFQRLNSLQSKTNTLEYQLRDLYQHNWIIPKFDVQGLSGHICYLCNTFSYRVVMDLGYDLTMQCKHNCNKQRGSFVVPIPQGTGDVDRWAAGILFNQMSYFDSIGNRLQLNDITRHFNVYRENEFRDIIFGIPDRHPIITLDGNSLEDLIEKTMTSPEQRMLMYNYQILDLLTVTKSTYGILQVPDQGDFRYLYMRIVR